MEIGRITKSNNVDEEKVTPSPSTLPFARLAADGTSISLDTYILHLITAEIPLIVL